KFLIVQATGTGKTRVAMAVVDVLRRARRAQKVLFLTDRKVLRDQATDAFKQWFPEETKQTIIAGKVNRDARLYSSTIQTMMKCYRDFSPGDFDVIISDEAHRSIYHKWKDVFTYFDAVQIGLTATPANIIDRDTYRFFGCENGVPTSMYDYQTAVDEGYLAEYRVHEAQTHFQIEGIKPDDIPDAIKKKLVEEGLEEDELVFEGTQIEKKVIVKGTNEAIVREFMDGCLTDKTGVLPAKSIFFAVSKKHAARLFEAFNKLYPQYKGELVEIITSEDSRAKDLITKFKTKSMPRIAISVDMLDTGVDVPEVCNLVFAKPVFSDIKFWQMIGRGTRSEQACEHMEWLPSGKKDIFLIFDFWKNFAYFDLNPKGRKSASTEAITTRIFKVRMLQYDRFVNAGQEKYAELYKQKIVNDIKSLPTDSIAIKENLRQIEKTLKPSFWKKAGTPPTDYLREHVTHLMRYQTGVNYNVASFTLAMEQLLLALLDDDRKKVEQLQVRIADYLWRLPDRLQQVKRKKKLLDTVRTKEFWENITYESALHVLEEFADLMSYARKEPRRPIELDLDDVVEQRKIIEYGPMAQTMEVEKYKEKVEKKVKNLAKSHPTIKKIEQDKAITKTDLEKLEKTLNQPDLWVTEATLQKAFQEHDGTLVEFIKKLLGLVAESPDPEQVISEEFKTFIVENNFLSADQINFMRTLQTVFLRKRHIEYEDLFELPFANVGAPIELFGEETLKKLVGLCNHLEKEVFA
ncbi:type I restriction endonuclease subunit R, partial [bacterium]|nr:type I restriction endonuclease subunit R [bacterium]